MNGIKIKPEQLSDAVGKELDKYAKTTADKVKEAVQDAADSAVKELKSTSPKKTGRYARSWRQKKAKETSSEKEIIVHAGVYQLTHLLENGHAKRGGGRVAGIPHIKPAEEHAIEKLESEIQKGVEHG